MKVVINSCYGGFGLSKKAYEMMGLEWDNYGHASDIDRNDPRLIEAVEKLGHEANGSYAKLAIVDIPEGIEWQIEEYDGMEWVSEQHRTWS